MNASPEQEPRQVHIRSGEELHRQLRCGDMMVRLELLSAISKNPDRATQYGSVEGEDIVDVLVEICGREKGLVFEAAANALVGFPDDRSLALLLQIAEESEDATLTRALLKGLGGWNFPEARVALSSVLFHSRPEIVRTAANALSPTVELTAKQGLRLALAANREVLLQVPSFQSDPELWMNELPGPFASSCRHFIEQQGEEAWNILTLRLDELSEQDREWHLHWGGREGFAAVSTMLEWHLRNGNKHLALDCAVRHGWEISSDTLGTMVEDSDPEIRRMAVLCGPPVTDWKTVYESEPEERVKEAWLQQMPAETELLMEMSLSDSWRERAAVAGVLIREGEFGWELARQMALSEKVKTRALGCQVLVDLGDDEWLEKNVLSPDGRFGSHFGLEQSS